MNKTRKILATLTMVAVAATSASLTTVSSAEAHWTGFPHGHHGHHHGLRRGEAAALGLLGGVIIGGAIANANRRPVQPVGRSSAHANWCSNRYRSYNIHTDTFTGFDGRRHYCNSPYSY